MNDTLKIIKITLEQTWIMVWKNLQQKRLEGRSTLKEFLIPAALLAFWIYIFLQSNDPITYADPTYALRNLPPLSTKGQYGIFQTADDDGIDVSMFVYTKLLLYSPNNHEGVNKLMDQLAIAYPQVEIRGKKTSSDVETEYQANLFSTWGALEFELNDDQLTTGQLITSTTSASSVSYKLRICPSVMTLPDSTRDEDVYRDAVASADAWINSGYLTLQNFIATYLATQYPGVPSNFTVDTFLQRYPRDPDQSKAPGADYSFSRFMLWKWVASFLLTACLILPLLTLASTTVKERENRMKDLLQISGLVDAAYWASYVVAGEIVSQAMTWIAILLLVAGSVLTGEHIPPYAALMTCYSLALIPFLLSFGFVVFRSEYYGLPAFLLSVALCVSGDYLADNENITIGVKLFLGFFAPPLTFTLGVFQTETYLYHHTSSDMDFSYTDQSKHLPSVNACCGVLIASALFYFFIAWGMPFDWILPKEDLAEILGRMDDAVVYPCDGEETEDENDSNALLKVRDVTHIYPDGTQAVKGITFSVRTGEVLSYLGANGAGKSTTMGMLCGTLPITYGDATVNGYSITRNKVLARRNLGICMQSDVIWDDISVIDHLYLFGRLRGMAGQELKDDVTRMIDSLGFPEKAYSAAGTLSGGQKRRLCVGISMVGGNSVVYLDEPTAGLDPVSRRHLWELVQRNRHGRAILLTTHFMDEADVLGDRIAIVKEGRLRALGTSRFLKKRFGMGYLLRCSMEANANIQPLQDTIMNYIHDASFVSNAGTEFAMRLSKESVSLFPSLLEELDNRKHQLSMLNYGIETTTLEEVFMRIVNEDTESLISNPQEANRLLGASGEERDEASLRQQQQDNKRYPLSAETITLLLQPGRKAGSTESSILTSQTSVLFWKRFYQFIRSKGQWSMGVFVPAAMIAISGVIMEAIPDKLIYGSPDVTDTTYDTIFTTPIAGENEIITEALATASGITETTYVGSNYTTLYNFLEDQTTAGMIASGASVYYAATNNATVLYNASYPIWYPGLISGVLQNALNDITNNLLTVNVISQPLAAQALQEQANLAICFFFVACLIAGSLGAGISIVISGERVGLVKHQQLASGASLFAYWLANFLWDYLVASIQVLCFTFALYCARATTYEGNDFATIFAIGLLFNLCVILRFYLFSNFVSDIRMAQTFYFYGSLLSQFVLTTFYSLIVYTVQDGDASSPVAKTIAIICTVIDPAFGYLFIVLIQNDFLGIRSQNNDATISSMETSGYIILTLFGMVFVYLLGVLYCELGWNQIITISTRFFCPSNKRIKTEGGGGGGGTGGGGGGGAASRHPGGVDSSLVEEFNPEEVLSVDDTDQPMDIIPIDDRPRIRMVGGLDPDVEQEKGRVAEVLATGKINTASHAIFVSKLNKIFYGRGSNPTKIAVKELSLAIGRGEIFGLLGANGAGKTTLLKIVSGLENPSSGFAMINGYDVINSRSSAQRSMGLCPQFDTLIERLTVRENFLLFGKVKGLSDEMLCSVCDAFMITLNIKRYENKLIQQLSGGNRRKVSLAIALLGAPPTVYLDEPSTGLDPVASRLMWRLLSKIAQAKKSAVVLTTHNMLECEAVCTRVGVMKLGELVCLGNTQHLRSVHGTGFLLEITVKNPEMLILCKQFIEENFKGAVVVDEHSTMLNYEVPKSSISRLSAAFSLMENNKDKLGIVDYALSQSTLEQVFLKQIRPNENDMALLAEQRKTESRVPRASDYFNAYLCWLLAFFLPGLHHFYLGNFWRGLKYLLTINEFFVGWLLDIFELHVLVKKSVEEYGSQPICSCCRCLCCKANRTTATPNSSSGNNSSP